MKKKTLGKVALIGGGIVAAVLGIIGLAKSGEKACNELTEECVPEECFDSEEEASEE